MILRRSGRTPKPVIKWEAEAAPLIASEPKITKKAAKTKQKTALKSVTISLPSEPTVLDKNNLSEQSKRTSVPVTEWEQTSAPSAALDPKITEETARTKQKTALKPMAIGSLLEALKLDENDLPKLPNYNPPLNLQFKALESLVTGLIELETFQRLFTLKIVDRIVLTTNSYAERAQKINKDTREQLKRPRPWKSVDSAEIWRFIGCLLHMGVHIKKRFKDH